MTLDQYKTLMGKSPEVLFKDRGSKFYGYAFPVLSEKEINNLLGILRKQHQKANHVCYAWELGADEKRHRANDDGEPKNSAGMPIYSQIKSFGLSQVLVVVVRYFGGTKLGIGGLVYAYRETAKLALENVEIISQPVRKKFRLTFPYSELHRVMGLFKKHDVLLLDRHQSLKCYYIIAVAKSQLVCFLNSMRKLHKATVNEVD